MNVLNANEELLRIATLFLDSFRCKLTETGSWNDIIRILEYEYCRLLANYLLMRLTLAWAPELTEKYQKERNDYRKILQVRFQPCIYTSVHSFIHRIIHLSQS